MRWVCAFASGPKHRRAGHELESAHSPELFCSQKPPKQSPEQQSPLWVHAALISRQEVEARHWCVVKSHDPLQQLSPSVQEARSALQRVVQTFPPLPGRHCPRQQSAVTEQATFCARQV